MPDDCPDCKPDELQITLVKSVIFSSKVQKDAASALGLKRVNQSVILRDTPDIREKIEILKNFVVVAEPVNK